MRVKEAIELINDVRSCQKALANAGEAGSGYIKIMSTLADEIDTHLDSLIELYEAKEIKA